MVDVIATIVDPDLGSCGELSEWVDGRLWRYEIDDDLFARLGWKPGRPEAGLGSPEYRAKRMFMRGLVGLMHDMGAHELARQYEWWTLKSQPNALKRLDPANARKLPLVLWHGYGQSSKTWETTPDGREGYQNIFLRRGFGVYVIDQPRRGNAGRSTQPITLTPVPDEQEWFDFFRIGIWPNFFPGVQFSHDPEALTQYFRQMTPDTGPIDINVTSDAVAALFSKIGPGILVTHSHSGGMGWRTVIKSRNVRAIVSYEPGSNFIFPNGEVPPPRSSCAGPLEAVGVPLSDFMKLTKIPIVIYYGDNIPDQPSANPGQDQWRVRLAMARLWRN